jgi:hypothetical protein
MNRLETIMRGITLGILVALATLVHQTSTTYCEMMRVVSDTSY